MHRPQKTGTEVKVEEIMGCKTKVAKQFKLTSRFAAGELEGDMWWTGARIVFALQRSTHCFPSL